MKPSGQALARRPSFLEEQHAAGRRLAMITTPPPSQFVWATSIGTQGSFGGGVKWLQNPAVDEVGALGCDDPHPSQASHPTSGPTLRQGDGDRRAETGGWLLEEAAPQSFISGGGGGAGSCLLN